MGLVSYSYYAESYLGEPVPEADFPRYEKRAEMLILNLIKMSTAQVAALPAATRELIEDAICVQIDYLFEYGPSVSVYGKEAGGGFTVGKVSVNNGSSTRAASGAQSMIAPGVYVYLEQTGLLYPGVPVADIPPQFWGCFV